MKLRWKLALVALVVATLGTVALAWRGNGAQRAVEEPRRALRSEGFKLELGEFQLATSTEVRERAAVLCAAGQACRNMSWPGMPELNRPVGTNAALVLWQQDRWETTFSEDVWPALRERLAENQAVLDQTCAAALSGPVGFEPVVRPNGTVLYPHLANVKTLAWTLAARTILELHDNHRAAAWTNLLALTRLVSTWNPEPSDIAHLVRFAALALAQSATWEFLQADGWTDEQLAVLQREWESAVLLGELPEAVAFSRASMVMVCRTEREQPLNLPPLGQFGPALVRSPKAAWGDLMSILRELRYRKIGSYEDEKALLLYFRQREHELRQAVRSASWSEMLGLPGVKSSPSFQSPSGGRSRMQVLLSLKQVALGHQSWGWHPLARAAEAEARRRLLVTALAIERHRLQQGARPESLQQLVPRWLPDLPTDFADGKPLRYHLTEHGCFVLYSVGLDCTDDQGLMTQRRPGGQYPLERDFGSRKGTDLVWPRPASPAAAIDPIPRAVPAVRNAVRSGG
jgi:hypothetical protein